MKHWRIGMLAMIVVAVSVAIWQWHQRSDGVTLVSDNVDIAPAELAAPEPPAAITAPPPEYYRDIKPIFDRRCVVCHGCYDAPCQLKLDSPEGIQRGATHAQVYDSARVLEAEPTRLFVDANSTAAWREKGFFAVLNEAENNPDNNFGNSVLYRMLKLKDEFPLGTGPLPKAIDTSLDRKAFCPNLDEFPRYAKERPQQGMPFGLPPLDDEEFNKVSRWLESGAHSDAAPELSALAQKEVAAWEHFLNRNDLKTRLMARYVFEHLFLADLYFDDNDKREFFKLVRSRTPSGKPIDIIATRRPYDDPGVERVYYRLQPYRATIVAKTHLPYALSDKRMQRFEELFLQPDYTVTELPSYATEVAANPFVAYAAIPVQSRYRFMLDEANFFISTFIKGPVCRGQIALNVIEDQFWVIFANPDVEAMVDADFLARESKHLRLPSELENQPLGLAKWKKYADLQTNYLAAKAAFLAEKFPKPKAVTLDLLWSGDGNQNAALTVFRHFDSASVVQGLIGPQPKTAWVIDYPMFERIYYLLAAGFDVYGDVSHQLLTRLYMDFLRMEGETNYLNFLPKAAREKIRNSWYQGVGAKFRDSVYRKAEDYQRESGIHYRGKSSQREFFDLLRERMEASISHHYDLSEAQLSPSSKELLQKIAQLHGYNVANYPETIFLRVIIRNEPDQLFTLIHNDDHSNVALLLFEQERRRPDRDTLSVVPGVVGAYPNAFWTVREDELPQLLRDMTDVHGPEGYRRLAANYAVSRSDLKFWQEADWVLNTYRNAEPIEWGVLDLSRYER